LSVLANGCQPPDDGYVPKATNPWLASGEVLLDSSLSLKGHASFLGTQTLCRAMSYLNHVNEQGEVHGRSIKVVAYDDSY